LSRALCLFCFLSVIILALTVIKDGHEDIKRHQVDRGVNYSTVRVLSGPHWKPTFSEDVCVGYFVKILDNESFPANTLICATSGDDNVGFVETKDLDRETNLKSKHAVQALTKLRNAKECANPDNALHMRCDRPEVDLYRLNTTVSINDDG
jgi:phospholipid-translocating ATPase